VRVRRASWAFPAECAWNESTHWCRQRLQSALQPAPLIQSVKGDCPLFSDASTSNFTQQPRPPGITNPPPLQQAISACACSRLCWQRHKKMKANIV